MNNIRREQLRIEIQRGIENGYPPMRWKAIQDELRELDEMEKRNDKDREMER